MTFPWFLLEWVRRKGSNCTIFAIENAPPSILYGRMAKRIVKMKKPIHQCLGLLPIASMTARFHFRVTLKIRAIISNAFFGRLWHNWLCNSSSILFPFLSYNLSHSNQKLENHNFKYLQVISLEPIDWQSGSLSGVSTSFTPKHDFANAAQFLQARKWRFVLKPFLIFKRLKIEGWSFHR